MSNVSEQTLFQQLAFFRNMTVQTAKHISPEQFDRIPEGCRNHLRWQLAHVWFVLERFVFHIGLNQFSDHDEQMKRYGNGSSPADWENANIPDAMEWIERLAAQPERIKQALSGTLDHALAEPFTFANGYTVTTARELLAYGLFHEGMHLSTIRSYMKS
jgi:hypothetical protein